MAKRRMFSAEVVCVDSFLELPCSAQALYLQLGTRADDDGLLGSPKSTARATGCTEEALQALISAGFIIAFPSGVVAITHWKKNNNIRKDRYTPTVYSAEFNQLEYDEEEEKYLLSCGVTTNPQPGGIPGDNQATVNLQPGDSQPAPSVIGIGTGIVSTTVSSAVTTPTKEEVYSYFRENQFKSDPDKFFSYNSGKGWKGNWKAYAKKWEKLERNPEKPKVEGRKPSFDSSKYFHPGGALHPPVPDYEEQKAKRIASG